MVESKRAMERIMIWVELTTTAVLLWHVSKIHVFPCQDFSFLVRSFESWL
jgi:hypothetical protein